jgi:hypothetical protein
VWLWLAQSPRERAGQLGEGAAALAAWGAGVRHARLAEGGAAAVASFLAAVLTEIYLRNVCSCQEILRRNGRGQREEMRDSLDQVGMDRTVVVAAYTMFQSNSESARGERKWLRRQDWNYQILDEVRARSRFVLGVPHILDLLERGPVSHWVRQAGRLASGVLSGAMVVRAGHAGAGPHDQERWLAEVRC